MSRKDLKGCEDPILIREEVLRKPKKYMKVYNRMADKKRENSRLFKQSR